jgi:hypothetical protein
MIELPGVSIRTVQKLVRALYLLATMPLLGGCAGYHYGVISQAYLASSAAPAEAEVIFDYHPDRPYRGSPELDVGGARLVVELGNAARTRMFETVLFVVPVTYSTRYRPLHGPRDTTRLWLRVMPESDGVVLRPGEARLIVDGSEMAAARYRLVPMHRSFEPQDTAWADDPGRELRLPAGSNSSYYIEFDHPRPRPARSIEVDLSRALVGPELQTVPPIRFRMVRWKKTFS